MTEHKHFTIRLDAEAKKLASKIDALARAVPDDTLREMLDDLASYPEMSNEEVNKTMDAALLAAWIRGIRGERDRRAREGLIN